MEILKFLIDFALHLDKHLNDLVSNYSTGTYLILFLIIFCETGLVATPFLPGDSLLFAAGAVTAYSEVLHIQVLIPLLFCAALLGDNVNYLIGRYLSHFVLKNKLLKRFVNKEYIERTHRFYEKHGGKTIVIARFMPIIRTFAPFVGGFGKMNYKRFILFCIAGALLWVNLLLFAGYYFGNLEFVKKNFELVIFAIILLSLIPPVVGFIRQRKVAAKIN